jgi:outer membrane lipoprotein-sorting protein
MCAPDPKPDDPLSRAEGALRGAPVPDGPSEEMVARTLAALLAAAGRPEGPLVHRRKSMLAFLKVAAAVLAAAGGLAYLGAPPPGGKLVAFAATVQALREAQGYSFRMTLSGADRPKESAKTYYKAPGVARTEIEGGQVVVVDLNQGKSLYLNPATKAALLIKSKPLEKGKAGAGLGLAEELGKLEAADGEPAGEKEIGGVKVRGFRVKKRTDEMTIWVDPRTGVPVQIETVSHFQGKEVRGTLSDFVINPDLDEALFRTEPPPGYTLRQSES